MALRKTPANVLQDGNESVDGGSISRLQRSLGLSDEEVVDILCLAPRATKHAAPESGVTFARLRNLESLDNRLRETFEAESARRWLRTKNRYLGDRRPLDLLRAGRFDRANAALEALDAGVFI